MGHTLRMHLGQVEVENFRAFGHAMLRLGAVVTDG
jgi:predicted ATP-dependent endonuclease of OLD family